MQRLVGSIFFLFFFAAHLQDFTQHTTLIFCQLEIKVNLDQLKWMTTLCIKKNKFLFRLRKKIFLCPLLLTSFERFTTASSTELKAWASALSRALLEGVVGCSHLWWRHQRFSFFFYPPSHRMASFQIVLALERGLYGKKGEGNTKKEDFDLRPALQNLHKKKRLRLVSRSRLPMDTQRGNKKLCRSLWMYKTVGSSVWWWPVALDWSRHQPGATVCPTRIYQAKHQTTTKERDYYIHTSMLRSDWVACQRHIYRDDKGGN